MILTVVTTIITITAAAIILLNILSPLLCYSAFYRIYRCSYSNPFMKDIKQSSAAIPTIPIAIPNIRLLHTITRHIPIPNNNAPIIPISSPPIIFPDSLIGSLFSIRLHINIVINSTMTPIIPTISPCLKAFHSNIRHMHIPSANKTPPIVPKIIAAKLLFFI